MRTLILASTLALLLSGCSIFGSRSEPRSVVLDAAGKPDAGPALHAAVADARVVFVGEGHDDRQHHRFQLQVLRTLDASEGAPPMLGMEMFQRPAQPHLDDYVEGRIDELEMLRRTEYFSRWRFDHTLYAPLWRYCREHGLRVIALNAEAEVVSKVGKTGLASLTPEERAKLADEIDLEVPSHVERVRGVLEKVHPLPEAEMQAFYEAQTSWDETMAESAARELLAAGPDSRMVVIAGGQHIQGRDGIPDRVGRRVPDAERLVIVLATLRGEDTPPSDPGKYGDFMVTFPHRADVVRPRLGVRLTNVENEVGLHFDEVVPGGSAASAGFLAGDVLVEMDGAPMTDLTDLRYLLDTRQLYETATLVVVREGERVSVETKLLPAPRPPEPRSTSGG